MNRSSSRSIWLILFAFFIVYVQGRHVTQPNGGIITIKSIPSGARLFIRTESHNGFEGVGVIPVTLKNVTPGLLE